MLALVTILLIGMPAALDAQEKEPAKVDAVRKVAAVDPKVLQSPAAPDPTMVLRSAAGKEIEAKLLSANGDTVRIARVDDGREFEVPLSTFDKYTVDRIRQWMERDPDAVEFALSISATKSLVDSSTFMSAGRDLKTAEWSYHVTVTNLTRNLLNGAQLEYRVVFDDEVEIARTIVAPGKGSDQQDGQLVDLPEMAYNDEIELDTPSLQLHTYEFIPSRGEREYSRDTLKGIWIRVLKNGKVISEYQSSPSTMATLSWDNEDEDEVRVRNDFRDQFSTGAKD